MNPHPEGIKGYGIDAEPSRRPGVPMELPPRALPHAKAPKRQQDPPAVPRIGGRSDRRMPPVYGSAQPPKGVSGAMRRWAYGYPGYMKRHWMMLLMADRVDVLEHRLKTFKGAASFAGLFFAGSLAASFLRSRSLA